LFVTVCVDSQKPEPVAREFQNLYFGTPGGSSSIINAFIEERDDYPKFPTQLGCQGLLLLDCEGRIATMRSPAFLDFREKAFEDVEHLLEALIATGKAQQVATSSSESLVSSEHVNLEGRLTSIASFSLNACSEEAVTLDEEWSDPDFQLPLIQHESIDQEHLVLEDLMRTAVRTQETRDVQALQIFFMQHSEHEEAIMRRSGFAAEREGNFSAIESHTRDHKNIVNFAESILHNTAEGSDRKLRVQQVTLLCRRIIEHVFTYDILLTGALDVD
jgi:hemerythrin